MSYTKEERECIIRMDESMDHWIVYSASPKMITKMKKIGEENIEIIREVKTEAGTAVEGEYKIPMGCVSFRKPSKKREMTEEQREAARERLAKAREKNK